MSFCMACFIEIDVMYGYFHKYINVTLAMGIGNSLFTQSVALGFVVVVDMEEGLRTKVGAEGP